MQGNTAFFAAANPWSPGQYNAGQGISADVGAGNLGQVAISASTPALNVAHPFFWFVAFAAATAALIGGSTSIKVGRAHARVSAGDGK